MMEHAWIGLQRAHDASKEGVEAEANVQGNAVVDFCRTAKASNLSGEERWFEHGEDVIDVLQGGCENRLRCVDLLKGSTGPCRTFIYIDITFLSYTTRNQDLPANHHLTPMILHICPPETAYLPHQHLKAY